MRKVIAAFNMTLDGVADHTAGIPDAEIHQHYADLLRGAGVILYGRTTFGLMKYWQEVLANPTGEPSMDEFAAVMDAVPKLVFSHTLKETDWATARLASRPLAEEVTALKQEAGADILVGSRSLILQLLKLGLVDEFQLCIYPVVAGGGMLLFEEGMERMTFRLAKTKAFRGGAVVLFYEPVRV